MSWNKHDITSHNDLRVQSFELDASAPLRDDVTFVNIESMSLCQDAWLNACLRHRCGCIISMIPKLRDKTSLWRKRLIGTHAV
jgi:hypothetical protein